MRNPDDETSSRWIHKRKYLGREKRERGRRKQKFEGALATCLMQGFSRPAPDLPIDILFWDKSYRKDTRKARQCVQQGYAPRRSTHGRQRLEKVSCQAASHPKDSIPPLDSDHATPGGHLARLNRDSSTRKNILHVKPLLPCTHPQCVFATVSHSCTSCFPYPFPRYFSATARLHM